MVRGGAELGVELGRSGAVVRGGAELGVELGRGGWSCGQGWSRVRGGAGQGWSDDCWGAPHLPA